LPKELNGFVLIENDAFDVIKQMHFLLTFGTSGGTVEQLAALRTSIESVLKAHPNYKALGNTYIVKVNSPVEWQAILQAIGPIAQSAPMPMNFIMTPLMQQGSPYNGWMPNPAWNEINKLTS
jgi:hypothetical protein